MLIPLTEKMVATNIPQEALPCAILAMMENSETIVLYQAT